jgi:hypothetical protein
VGGREAGGVVAVAVAYVGCLAPTLEEARNQIGGGEFTRVGRNVGDDPVILEVWL